MKTKPSSPNPTNPSIHPISYVASSKPYIPKGKTKKPAKKPKNEPKQMEQGNHLTHDKKTNGGQDKGQKRAFSPRKHVIFDPLSISDGKNTVKLMIEKTFRNTHKFKILLNDNEISPMGFPSISNTEKFWDGLKLMLNTELIK
jgi:hypothetical protein